MPATARSTTRRCVAALALLATLTACGSAGRGAGAGTGPDGLPGGPSASPSSSPSSSPADRPGLVDADTTSRRSPTTQAATSTAAIRPPAAVVPVAPGTAVTTLALLTVKGRAPRTGYDRARFGQAWADTDRNGCDTRNDVLRRDLTAYTLKSGTHGCLVLRGTLHDPYTGTSIAFVRGPSTSNAVQVDHVVALADAWQKGAQPWSDQRRTGFANDPLNLLAVDGPTNLRKGDADAATWLPPRRSSRCAYVARQVAVKHAYALSVTVAERDAMVRVLETCPQQTLPSAVPFRLGGGVVGTAAGSRLAGPSPAPLPSAGVDPRFGTCRDAVAQGFGPYRSGVDPEYDWYRDADSDGVVCE
jgi:Protein of unknown function (DUF1524)/Excalibur calcium-binding domain